MNWIRCCFKSDWLPPIYEHVLLNISHIEYSGESCIVEGCIADNDDGSPDGFHVFIIDEVLKIELPWFVTHWTLMPQAPELSEDNLDSYRKYITETNQVKEEIKKND